MLTRTFHGHACFTLEADGRRVVLLSHGHGDHLVQPRAVIPMHYNTWDVTLTPFPDEVRPLRSW